MQNKYDYNSFISKTQNSIRTYPKLFWKFIGNKRFNSSLPESINYNNVNYCGDIAISNCFAQYFSSVFAQPNNNNTVLSVDNNNTLSVDFNRCILTSNYVYEELKHLNIKSCPGPDAIPYIFLATVNSF